MDGRPIAAQVDDAIAQVGREKIILAPGCTIPSFSPAAAWRFCAPARLAVKAGPGARGETFVSQH